MKLQERPGWCSVACVQNALRCLGIKKPQRAIRAQMDLAQPSYEKEIIRALAGFQVDEYHGTEPAKALAWLTMHVGVRGPAIILVDDSDHYVTVIGVCGSSFVVFDPSNVQQAKTEHGVRIYSWRSMRARWWTATDDGNLYYGIGVSK